MKPATAATNDASSATVIVIGAATGIAALVPPGSRVVRVVDRDLDFGAQPIALVVLDARTLSLRELTEIRHSVHLAHVPALLLADDENDPALAVIDADDVLSLPFARTATTRVRSLVELGRTRFALQAEVDRLLALLIRRQAFDQAILDGVDVGIVTTDTRGRVTFVNREARDVLRRGGDLDGHDVKELLALPVSPDAILVRESERRWVHSLRCGERDVEIDLAVSRAHQAAQEQLGYFFIFRDRTHEKQLEADRRRFERLAAMGTMVAGFAHEIRNPMASLRSIAEALNEELAEAGVKLPHVDRMLKVLERVESLVRTSLLFGRPSPPRPAAHKPWAILSTAVSALAPRTSVLGGELSIDAAVDLPDVFVDDGQIVQALVILLNNALDATGLPKRVHLRAQTVRSADSAEAEQPASRPLVRFDVSDDGPGIPPEILGRIFDPFFTTKASGTGLGLSIAQQLVTENAARLEVVSPVGGPTTFSVLVPRATAETMSSRRSPRGVGPPYSSLVSGK